MKKGFSILLAVVLLAGSLAVVLPGISFTVSADEGDFWYTVIDGEATLTGYTGFGGDVIIPSTLGGYPVTAIGEWVFSNCQELTGVRIPSTVKKIGEWAFSFCGGLTDLEIPGSVKIFETNAFCQCTALKKLEISENVTEIMLGAFQGCAGLESITVSELSENYYASGNCLIEKKTGVLVLGCKNSVIPDGVTSIGNSSFAYCTELTSIEIPSGVTTIEDLAFAYCDGLTSIEIASSVETMGSGVFLECKSLADIYCLASKEPEGWSNGGFFGTWLGNSKATVHWAEADEPELALGDLGGDGTVDATDYMLLKRAVLETYTLTEEQRAAADINGDGEVNATDYMLLKRAVLGTYVIA